MNCRTPAMTPHGFGTSRARGNSPGPSSLRRPGASGIAGDERPVGGQRGDEVDAYPRDVSGTADRARVPSTARG